MFNKPRGTQDIIHPRSSIYWNINRILINILNREGFRPIITPSFEYEDYFVDSLGLNSEIVLKEIYKFKDKKGRKLALRPEGTSSVLRAVAENKLVDNNFPLKLYYWENMFRYERPQNNRYREFTQLGVEIINSEGVVSDFSLIDLCYNMMFALGINNPILEINFVGNEESKQKYFNLLEDFCLKNVKRLCFDCQKNFSINLLSLLNCDSCSKLDGFPAYKDALIEEDQKYFFILIDFLKKNDFDFIINDKLIRGLNYYTGLIFELSLGEDKAIIGGGRYDKLYKKLFNYDYSSAGFAVGIDRLISYLLKNNINSPALSKKKVDVFFLILNNSFYEKIFFWKKELKEKNFSVEYNLNLLKDKKREKILKKIISYYNPNLLFILEEKEIKFKQCSKLNKWTIIEENDILNNIYNVLI